jgi:hypothetical protein
MRYKGFEIEPVHSMCADWKLDKNDKVVSKKPKSSDIEYYQILDNGRRWICENTISECKQTIDDFLSRNNLKKNTVD